MTAKLHKGLLNRKRSKRPAAQRQAEQQAAWQRHGDPYSFEQVVDATAEPPAQTALQRQAEQEYQAALQQQFLDDHAFPQNNLFRSAEAAPLARRLNVPFALMS